MKKHVTDRDLIAKDELKNIRSNYGVSKEDLDKARQESGHPRSKRLVFAALLAAGYAMITRYMKNKKKGSL